MIDELNKKGQYWRSVVFKPLLSFLTKIGFSANKITNLRLFFGIIFLYWFQINVYQASLFMLFILFLDCIDGSLARYQNKSSDKGKFLDVMVDHTIYFFMILCFFILEANVIYISYNIFIVGMAYLLAVVYKEERQPSDWIIKPYPKLTYLRTITVIAFYLAIFGDLNILNEGLLVSNIIATYLSLYYWTKLQLRWNKI